jgi:hypothetical protein
VAAGYFDEAFVLEYRHCAVGGANRHRVGCGEFSDCRQLAAGLKVAEPDLIPEARRDDLVRSAWPLRGRGFRDDVGYRRGGPAVALIDPGRIPSVWGSSATFRRCPVLVSFSLILALVWALLRWIQRIARSKSTWRHRSADTPPRRDPVIIVSQSSRPHSGSAQAVLSSAAASLALDRRTVRGWRPPAQRPQSTA